MQATAFTVGHNIFLGSDAARPGTSAGNQLLAHEVGHVVDEGGGGAASSRVRRSTGLRPLESAGAPTVRRLFGSGKKKRKKQEEHQAALQASIHAAAEREAENHPHFAPLKSAVARLERIVAALHDDQSQLAVAGPKIIALARQIDASFEGAERDPGFGPLKRRLRIMADDVQILLDHASVADTKRQAADIYMNEGRQGNFKALTAGMRQSEFSGNASKRQAAGEALGLSKAEQTAITVFTAQDYRYINPATANSRSWMLAMRSDEDTVGEHGPKKTNTRIASQNDDRLVANRMEEGSLHAGMAMQGLSKMPVFAGPTFRGETFTEAAFKQRFKVDKKGRVTARQSTVTRTSISSAAKVRDVAESFIVASSLDLGFGAQTRSKAYCLLWEFDVTNGRDIEAMSASSHEREVVTLPGASFTIVSIEPMQKNGHPKLGGFENIWVVKAKQVK